MALLQAQTAGALLQSYVWPQPSPAAAEHSASLAHLGSEGAQSHQISLECAQR